MLETRVRQQLGFNYKYIVLFMRDIQIAWRIQMEGKYIFNQKMGNFFWFLTRFFAVQRVEENNLY